MGTATSYRVEAGGLHEAPTPPPAPQPPMPPPATTPVPPPATTPVPPSEPGFGGGGTGGGGVPPVLTHVVGCVPFCSTVLLRGASYEELSRVSGVFLCFF